MRCAIGVRITGDSLAIGAVEDNRVVGPIRRYPEESGPGESLAATPAEGFGDILRREIEQAAAGAEISAIGIGAPGIIRDGLIEECPNLQQLKGLNLRDSLSIARSNGGRPIRQQRGDLPELRQKTGFGSHPGPDQKAA